MTNGMYPTKDFAIEKLLELRKEENTRFWTVFSILSITNGVLINAAISKDADPTLLKYLGIVGLLMSVSWTAIQFRFSHYCRHWETKIKTLEEGVEDSLKFFTESKPPWYSVSTKRGGYLNWLFLASWLGLGLKAFLF